MLSALSVGRCSCLVCCVHDRRYTPLAPDQPSDKVQPAQHSTLGVGSLHCGYYLKCIQELAIDLKGQLSGKLFPFQGLGIQNTPQPPPSRLRYDLDADLKSTSHCPVVTVHDTPSLSHSYLSWKSDVPYFKSDWFNNEQLRHQPESASHNTWSLVHIFPCLQLNFLLC